MFFGKNTIQNTYYIYFILTNSLVHCLWPNKFIKICSSEDHIAFSKKL